MQQQLLLAVDNALDDRSRRTVKHVLQIGVDGLHHDCWLDAPGGAPNLLRLAEGAAAACSCVTPGVNNIYNDKLQLL